MMDFGEGGDGPEIKRRKAFTKRETLQRLEELGDNVSKAVSEMVSDLSPFDVNGEVRSEEVHGFILLVSFVLMVKYSNCGSLKLFST